MFNNQYRPILMPTKVYNETFAGVTYHLDGELVPVLTVELAPKQKIFFEHHILLWKNTTVNIGIRSMKRIVRRLISGMQIFISEAEGPGQIAFSRDGAGQVFGIHMKQGEELHVREHQFLAATDNIEYSFKRIRGISNMLFGNAGFFIDRFYCTKGEGILWLHGYGNVFEKNLTSGEKIDIEPGSWLYKEPSVDMKTNIQGITVGILAGTNILMNRFIGPGKVGIQSMYFHLQTNEKEDKETQDK